jgi:hypothetical protein
MRGKAQDGTKEGTGICGAAETKGTGCRSPGTFGRGYRPGPGKKRHERLWRNPKEVRQATGGEISLNPIPAFMYVLAAASYVFRASFDPPFESVRIERLEETLARYALAGFVHITIRNPPPGAGAPAMDRAALVAQLVTQYLQVSEDHRGNIAIVLKSGDKNPQAIIAHLGDWA